MNEPSRPRSPNLLLGAAAAAAIITIFAGVIAIVLFLLLQQWVPLGLALIAVGGTAGLVLNAVLRR